MRNIKNFFTSPAILVFLLLINTCLHYLNFSFEKIDLPQATKNLIVSTIKNELSADAKNKEVKNLENVLDEISYANQLGRLDTISLLLALFALVLGFGAVAGFLHVKEMSNSIARDEAQKWLAENGEALITKWQMQDDQARNDKGGQIVTKEKKRPVGKKRMPKKGFGGAYENEE